MQRRRESVSGGGTPVPGARSHWPGPGAAVYEWMTDVVAANVAAATTSLTILGRGARSLRQAGRGLFWIIVEDEAAVARAHLAAVTPGDVVRLEVDLVARRVARTAAHAAMLTGMAAQVTEDAAFPLVRRTIDLLAAPPAV